MQKHIPLTKNIILLYRYARQQISQPRGVIMADKTKSKPQKLDGYSQQKLGHAFMSLYNALVAECQAHDKTLGTAWYEALEKIHAIVESKKSETQSYDYLMKFYMSHRQEYIKKMMTDKNKDSTIQHNAEQIKAAADRVQEERKKFDDAIKSVNDGEVLIVLKPVEKQPVKSFFEWASGRKFDLDIDPRSLERAYKKYILQQKNK